MTTILSFLLASLQFITNSFQNHNNPVHLLNMTVKYYNESNYIPYAPWCWNIHQHLPEQNHPVL